MKHQLGLLAFVSALSLFQLDAAKQRATAAAQTLEDALDFIGIEIGDECSAFLREANWSKATEAGEEIRRRKDNPLSRVTESEELLFEALTTINQAEQRTKSDHKISILSTAVNESLNLLHGATINRSGNTISIDNPYLLRVLDLAIQCFAIALNAYCTEHNQGDATTLRPSAIQFDLHIHDVEQLCPVVEELIELRACPQDINNAGKVLVKILRIACRGTALAAASPKTPKLKSPKTPKTPGKGKRK